MNEAVSLGRDGFVADGFWTQSVGLPLAVVCFDIDLLAFNHPEVASDKNGSFGSFRALCARALIKAYCYVGNTYSHMRKLLKVLESQERPLKSTSSACRLKIEHLPQGRCSIISSLEERTLKVLVFPNANIWDKFKISKVVWKFWE